MKAFLTIAKAIADETRARILMFLRTRELCVCQIVDVLELAPSTVSKHMAILAQAGLVEYRKDGRWRHYRVAGADAPPAVRSALEWLYASAADSPIVHADAERTVSAMGKDVKMLCERYKC